MKKLIVGILMVMVMVVGMVGVVGATDVGGIIDVDTTWDLAGSPYILVEPVEIAPGIILMIEPGVEVRSIESGGDYKLRNYISIYDNAQLNILGQPHNKIHFNYVNIYVYDGSVSGGPRLYIEFTNFHQCSINGCILNLTDCVFTKDIDDLHLTSIVLKSFNDGSDWEIDEDSYVERNIFNQPEQVAFSTHYYAGNFYITNNVFYKTWVHGDVFPNVIIRHNSFLEITMMNTIFVENNWWGTIDTNIIDEMIIDRNDSLQYGYYTDYIPFLIESHPNTPYFDPNIYYDLIVNTTDGGVVDPTGGNYLEGTIVTVTAISDSGWNFQEWTGDYIGTENPIDIIMDSNKTIQAVFVYHTAPIVPPNSNSGGGGCFISVTY